MVHLKCIILLLLPPPPLPSRLLETCVSYTPTVINSLAAITSCCKNSGLRGAVGTRQSTKWESKLTTEARCFTTGISDQMSINPTSPITPVPPSVQRNSAPHHLPNLDQPGGSAWGLSCHWCRSTRQWGGGGFNVKRTHYVNSYRTIFVVFYSSVDNLNIILKFDGVRLLWSLLKAQDPQVWVTSFTPFPQLIAPGCRCCCLGHLPLYCERWALFSSFGMA